MNPSDLSAEYGNIKKYCREQSAKSFKHPLAKQPDAPAGQSAEAAPVEDLSDSDIEALLQEESP